MTISNTSSCLTWSVQLTPSILLQHNISELSKWHHPSPNYKRFDSTYRHALQLTNKLFSARQISVDKIVNKTFWTRFFWGGEEEGNLHYEGYHCTIYHLTPPSVNSYAWSPNSLFKCLPICLGPFGLYFTIIFGTLLLFIPVTCRSHIPKVKVGWGKIWQMRRLIFCRLKHCPTKQRIVCSVTSCTVLLKINNSVCVQTCVSIFTLCSMHVFLMYEHHTMRQCNGVRVGEVIGRPAGQNPVAVKWGGRIFWTKKILNY